MPYDFIAAFGFLNGIRGLASSFHQGKSINEIINRLDNIDGRLNEIEKIGDNIYHIKSIQEVFHTRQQFLSDILRVKPFLDELQNQLGGALLSTAFICNSNEIEALFNSPVKEVLDMITPVNQLKPHTNPNMLPVIFSDSYGIYVGWIMKGMASSVLGLQLGSNLMNSGNESPSHWKFGSNIKRYIKDERFESVQIGRQIWMKNNLNLSYHAEGASCCYGFDERNCQQYGRLYNLKAAIYVTRNIDGWRLPSPNDFRELIECLDARNEAFRRLLVSGDSGFDAYLAGMFNIISVRFRTDTFFWSSYEGGGSFWTTDQGGYSGESLWLDSKTKEASIIDHSRSLRGYIRLIKE